MKKKEHIVKIIWFGGKETIKIYKTRKGAKREYKRLTRSGNKIYKGDNPLIKELYTDKYKVIIK